MDHAERAYRRGVHQALAFAGVQVGQCRTIEEARRVVGRAEDEAKDIREDSGFGGGVIDEILDRLRRPISLDERA